MQKKRKKLSATFAKDKFFFIASGVLVFSFSALIAYAIFETTQTTPPSQPMIAQHTPEPTPLHVTPFVTNTVTATSQPIKPTATARPKGPTATPTLKPGIDMAFELVNFDGPAATGSYVSRYQAKNGQSLTVENDRNASYFEINVVLANKGTELAKDIKTVYYLNDVEFAQGLTEIPGGMYRTDTAVKIKIPSEKGTHRIRIEIDPERKLGETNYANNTHSFTYTVK